MGLQTGLAKPLQPYLQHALWARAASGVAANYDSAVLADTPVGFWTLKEPSGTTAADATGNGHTGTYSGTLTLAQTGPCSDGETGVFFNGGLVTIPDAAALRITGDLSLEAWIKPFTGSTTGELITKAVSNGATNCPYDFDLVANDLPNFTQSDGTSFSSKASTGVATQMSWTHVVVTRTTSDATVRFYVNGSLSEAAQTLGHNPPTDGAANVLLAGRGDGATYVGYLAKAAIYNKVLTPTQVSNHYAAR